jgi:hypothetical protein
MTSFERNSMVFLRLSLSLLAEEQPAPLVEEQPAPPVEEQPAPPVEEQPAPVVEEQPAPQTGLADILIPMDAPRNYLSAKIASFANDIDRFFGGDRHYQESNQSVLQMDLTRVTGYNGDPKFKLGARLNLRLPITEGRLHLLVETDPEKNITAEPTPGSTPSQTVLRNKVVAPSSYALAARYEKAVTDAWHFNTDWGLKFPLPITPFVRARGSFSAPMGELWRFKAAQSVYWFNTIGVGETTQVDFERFISEPVLFRATSTVTWLNDAQNFDMRQDFSVFHTLDDRTALLYQAGVSGISNPQYQVTDCVALVVYRYRMHKEWLFLELSPQLHFPRDRQYRASPAFSFRLEALFDESR